LRLERRQPPRRAEWICETGQEWSGTRLIFDIQPAAGGTVIRLTHDAWTSETDYFVSCNTT